MQMLRAFGTLKAHQLHLELGIADCDASRAPDDAGLHSDFLVRVLFGFGFFGFFLYFAVLGFLLREDSCRFPYEACEVPLLNRFVLPKAKGFLLGSHLHSVIPVSVLS